MNNKLRVVTFPCFTHEQVKEINKEIEKYISRREDWGKMRVPASKKGDFFVIECMPLLEVVYPWIRECQIANREIFGYGVDWSFHLDTFNYNVYGIDGEYDWHIDGFNDNRPADMKLTCLLNLSKEPYEGGEFCTINSDGPWEFTSGMGLVTNPLVAHKVTPVTKGERITLTYWAKGPSWR